MNMLFEKIFDARPRARSRRSEALGVAARFALGLGVFTLVAGVAVGAWAVHRTAPAVGPLLDNGAVPSRIYSRPLVVDGERTLSADDLSAYLETLGYRRSEMVGRDPSSLAPGWYTVFAETERPVGTEAPAGTGEIEVALRTREPLHPTAPPAGQLVVARFAAEHSTRVLVDGVEQDWILLEPAQISRWLDPNRVEVRPLDGAPVPENLALAVMAAEDAAFENHMGISLSGIVRAAWKNFRAGSVRQGASTITQQLARNRFLTHERSLERKVREALMALVLEQRHSKDEILSAYADLVYLGVRHGANVVGFGAGAYEYFGKRIDDLTLSEAATLAGMVAAPGRYSPSVDADRSAERRDWVLRRLSDLGWVDEQDLERAFNEPLRIAFAEESAVDARYYARMTERWLAERAGVSDLETAGYRIDGTLDWIDQRRAEATVVSGLAALEESKSRKIGDDLEAALISLDANDGSVLAYVGGRNYDRSQFDRAIQARRQIGSLFKPVVFAAAYQMGVAGPSSRVDDLPLAVSYGDQVWAPDNSDGRYRGTVSVQHALELSLNAATVRLATRTGLGRVRAVARGLGLPASGGPSLVLGATDASVWQVADAYTVFASEGIRREVRPIEQVFDRHGLELESIPTAQQERALEPATVRALNQGLQGVLKRGTGAGARRAGLRDDLGGKTGTSNQRRDSWFAGFSPERVTVTWVGHDSYAPTPFTGATGALPIWTDFMLAVRPRSGYGKLQPLAPGEERQLEDSECWIASQVDDSCRPAVEYETWRNRYGLFAALQGPIAEQQGPIEDHLASEDGASGAAAGAAATLAVSERELQLREVVQLDGPFGDVTKRRVQWVAVSGGG